MEELWSSDKYFDVRKSAEYLGVSEVTLRKWIKSEEIKSLVVKSSKNGHDKYVIHKTELEFFKKKIMPNIYKAKNVPRNYRKKSFVERLWGRIKNALQI